MVDAMSVNELSAARKDEIGLLASSLNDMQNIIVANMRDLKEKPASA